ncbi:hypothetical protein V6N13_123665 [Hibiscus sabdariffa]
MRSRTNGQIGWLVHEWSNNRKKYILFVKEGAAGESYCLWELSSFKQFASDDWTNCGCAALALERTVQLFEKNTYSVVNIFDVTGAVEIPQGNGSDVDVVWDEKGHIVTNYHGKS